jgi:hypothetical protein
VNPFLELGLVSFVYMLVVNLVMKKVGGAELRELEKQTKTLLAKARKGDESALDKLNSVNGKRMKLTMRAQLYLFPIMIPTLFFIRGRYAELQWTLFGHTFGWLGAFIILGIPANMLSSRLAQLILGHS